MGWKTDSVIDTVNRLRHYQKLLASWFPTIWKDAEHFRNLKARGEANWENWCYMPLAGAYAIATQGKDLDQVPEDVQSGISQLIPEIGALTAWRTTQGIYRFHPEVFEAVWSTELTGEIPVDLLYRLPEWCPYIETPGKFMGGKALLGFFIHLEHDANDGRHELRLLLDFGGDTMVLIPIILHISGRKTIEEMVDGYVDECMRLASSSIPGQTGEVREGLKSLAMSQAKAATPLISLVIYLCSSTRDFRDAEGSNRQPARPRPKKIKGGLRLFPPDKPTVWDTGFRMGSLIDKARAEYSSEPQGGTHASPVPHVRRPHWHHFWKGPKAEPAKRELVCYWMPPIPVKMSKDIEEEIVPTIHPVK